VARALAKLTQMRWLWEAQWARVEAACADGARAAAVER